MDDDDDDYFPPPPVLNPNREESLSGLLEEASEILDNYKFRRFIPEFLFEGPEEDLVFYLPALRFFSLDSDEVDLIGQIGPMAHGAFGIAKARLQERLWSEEDRLRELEGEIKSRKYVNMGSDKGAKPIKITADMASALVKSDAKYKKINDQIRQLRFKIARVDACLKAIELRATQSSAMMGRRNKLIGLGGQQQ